MLHKCYLNLILDETRSTYTPKLHARVQGLDCVLFNIILDIFVEEVTSRFDFVFNELLELTTNFILKLHTENVIFLNSFYKI